MRSKGLGWLWGLAERRKLDAGGGWGWRRNTSGGAGGPADGPCSVLYGKNQRRGRRRVRRRRIFIQPPEMVERQLGVAFLMRSGSSCVGTVQPTFYYPKSACSSLPCSIVLACTRLIGFQLLAAIQHCIFNPVPLSRFIYHGYGVPLLCTL